MRLFCFAMFWLLGLTVANADVVRLGQWEQIDFDSHPALNQHVFFYELARSETLFAKEVTDNPALTSSQKQVLGEAVAAYRPFAAERKDLLRSDTELAGITNALMSREDPPEDCPTLCPVFQKAAPIYEVYFWPQHQQVNNRWVADLMPKLEAHGAAVLKRLEELFQTPLIEDRHIVDLLPYVAPNGATTSGRRPHTLLTGHLEKYQGWSGFEMVFHEIAHTRATSRKSPFRKTLDEKLKGQHRNLWHAIHFYTVGYVVEAQLAEAGIEYQAYAKSLGIFDRFWAQYVPLMEAHWLPYLNGHVTMEKALTNLVEALPKS